jgi:two-component sensor histidine kinase
MLSMRANRGPETRSRMLLQASDITLLMTGCSDQRFHLLIREANHRMRNPLGLVQVIANQTAAEIRKALSSGLRIASGRSQPIRTW